MTNLVTCPMSSQNLAAVDDQIGLVLRVLGNLQLTGHSRTYQADIPTGQASAGNTDLGSA